MEQTSHISRRHLLQSAAAVALGALNPAIAMARGAGKVVVELFTSQGCSSCPPADALLRELSTMKGVLALTYNVDYWNYLGWRDTLSLPEFSQRQYDYAKSRGDMDVYTPQIIVNGGSHLVGSKRAAVLQEIEQALARTDSPIALSMSPQGSDIVVEIGSAPQPISATLWLMPIIPSVSVQIDKGENKGLEIVYTNVVRKIVPAGMWHGSDQKISLPRDGILEADYKACVAILQQGKTGSVIGSAHWGAIGA